MKFWDWYLKIAVGSAMVGGSMELFMIKTGFCILGPCFIKASSFLANKILAYHDKVAVLESEKRAWESSPEAQAMRDALNPWRHQEKEAEKSS